MCSQTENTPRRTHITWRCLLLSPRLSAGSARPDSHSFVCNQKGPQSEIQSPLAARPLSPPTLSDQQRPLSLKVTQKPPVRIPEEFRLPIGARKSGKTEPASHGLGAMGFSGFGRLGNECEPAVTRPGMTRVVRRRGLWSCTFRGRCGRSRGVCRSLHRPARDCLQAEMKASRSGGVSAHAGS